MHVLLLTPPPALIPLSPFQHSALLLVAAVVLRAKMPPQSLFALTVSNVKAHPSDFVGPNIAGALVQALETGVLINQSIRFWSRSSNEHSVIKALVVFVSVASLSVAL